MAGNFTACSIDLVRTRLYESFKESFLLQNSSQKEWLINIGMMSLTIFNAAPPNKRSPLRIVTTVAVFLDDSLKVQGTL